MLLLLLDLIMYFLSAQFMVNLGKLIPPKAVYFKIPIYNVIDALCHLQQLKVRSI